MTLPLRSNTLTGLVVVALGRQVICSADGAHGKRTLVLPAESYPPRTEPCHRCEHQARLECASIINCPTAEAWAVASRAYDDMKESP